MIFVTNLHFRDTIVPVYSYSREDAIADYDAAKKNRDICNVTGGILVAEVSIGSGIYTYYSNKRYKHGTIVTVPTRFGTTKGRVMSVKVMTKQQLKAIADRNGFAMEDFKEIV